MVFEIFPMSMVIIENVSYLNSFVSRRLLLINFLIYSKVFQNPLIIFQSILLNTINNTSLVHVLINRAKSIIRCRLSKSFQRVSLDYVKVVFADK